MHTQLMRKLSAAAEIEVPDEAALNVILRSLRNFEPNATILREGEKLVDHCLLLDGWAARCKTLADGSRQILAILLPGDFCSDKGLSPVPLDHEIVAICSAVVARFSTCDLQQTLFRSPAICKALWRHNLVEEAIQRSWVASLGRRDAQTRLAHLICELHIRLGWLGQISDDTFRLPLTQQALADALGLTAVHVNRSMQALRRKGLIASAAKSVKILDADQLRSLAGFSADYLMDPLEANLPF